LEHAPKIRTAGAVLVTALALVAGLSVSLAAVQAANPASTLGVYRGAANPSSVATFGQWAGAPVAYAEDFLPGDSWATIESPMWWLNAWQGKGYRMVYGVPIIPGTGGSLAEGASGAYNAHYQKLAQNLVAAGQGNAILRPGWEFGGGWYLWKVANTTDAANYAAYWRQIVTTMRAVAPNLKFDWNPIWGWQSVDPTAAYPGDAYVDYIGIDVYDQSWISNYTDPVARWNDFLSAQWGLSWHRDFAAAHGKPMSFPEWGVAIRSDGHGGGDNSYFVEKMTQWIASNNVGYHVYFAFDAPDGAHDLMDGSFPNAAAAFKTAMSTSGSTPATTTAPPTTTTTPPATTATTTTPTTTTPTTTTPTTTTPTPPPADASRYLSSLAPLSASNGWGPYEKDLSNGEKGAKDGHTLKLNGTTFAKGLGVHAGSDLTFDLTKGSWTTFTSSIGIDDEVGSGGSVLFRIYLDGKMVYDTATMTGSTATKKISLTVSGKKKLRLVVVSPSSNINSDHADWASAKLS
jgi:cell division septation protein DedD